MRILFLVLLLPFFAQAQDYNYEFITNGYFYMPDDTTQAIKLPVRVIKHYNDLKIISNQNMSNVLFDKKIEFLGCYNMEQTLIYVQEDGQLLLIISPFEGIVKILNRDSTQSLRRQYGN